MTKLVNSWKKVLLVALVLPLAAAGVPRPAQADNPVLVAAIGAGAVVTAAAIGAGATVAAAVIVAGATIYASSGDDDDGDDRENGDGGDASTERNRRRSQHIGEQQLGAGVRPYVDREIGIAASDTQSSDVPGSHRVQATANYRFEGNVLLTPLDVTSLSLRDGMTFRFDVTNLVDAKDAPIVLNIDQLALSTQDIPKTHGHAQLRFIARQDGREIWTSFARVDQGQRPSVSGPAAFQAAALDDQADRLVIEALSLPVPYTAPGLGKTTRVEVEVKIEAEGARG